jgi:thymidylate synthase
MEKRNLLDKQYTELLQDILDNGHQKGDRTGTGTISVFGRQIRHKMSEGFPLITTKKMHWKSIIIELLWFLRGDTNIKHLVDNGCNIWNGDAYKNYTKYPLATIHDHHTNILYQNRDKGWCMLNGRSMVSPHPTRHLTQEEFINKIKTDDEFAKKWGSLGKIYGYQWRNWNGNIDQISELIKQLKENPDSRRLLVSAWNISDLPHQVLPPCHTEFQFYTRELSEKERVKLYEQKTNADTLLFPILRENLDFHNIPTRAISLMWKQRSVDTFLGLPFNIASYGLLLEIIAKTVNMVPDELIGNLGDTHLYLNHIEQAKEQIGRDFTLDERIDLASADIHFEPLEFGVGNVTEEHCHDICDEYGIARKTRQPFDLPTLRHMKTDEFYKSLSEDISLINHLDKNDFQIDNYKSHSKIEAPLSN